MFLYLVAKDWVELAGSGDRFSFKEVGRQDGSIELFDKSRGGVGVRIFADKSEWRTRMKPMENGHRCGPKPGRRQPTCAPN